MNDMVVLLKEIASSLASIDERLRHLSPDDVLTRPAYSCNEVATLSKQFGIQTYSAFTIRLAASTGRLPEAVKRANGQWMIPQVAARRILEDGLPPERRHTNGGET